MSRPPHTLRYGPRGRPSNYERYLRETYEVTTSTPIEVQQKLLSLVNQLCDVAEAHDIPPRTTAAVLATWIGLTAMAEAGGNAHDDACFDDFLDWCYAAMQVAVAAARIKTGWTPAGPS